MWSAITAVAPASRITSETTRTPDYATCRSKISSTTVSGSKIVRIAHDLLVWTQRLLLTGELAKSEPKRLRYRILHVAGRLSFHARKATLQIQAGWPWVSDLTIAFQRLRALPAPPG